MPQTPRINRRRLIIFKSVTLLLAPILVLLFLEVGLRIIGFGYNTDVFIEKDGLVRSNWRFTFNYFPWSMARPMAPVSFAAKKPADTLRVFVLGGSAAQGFPEKSLGMAAQLRVILEDAYPGRNIEVINAAITAVNSHVVLPVARACLEYDPDFLVIYLGNNEVVGPYGAGTAFSGFTNSLGMIRFITALKSMRLYQLGFLLSGRHTTTAGTWKGMGFFLQNTLFADDERLQVVYGHFRKNLQDLIDCAQERKCQVLLSTVGVNLVDNPPFASAEPELPTPQAKAAWNAKYREAEAYLTGGRFGEAVDLFKAVAGSAPQHAEAQYLLGLSYQGHGDPEAASRAFSRSRDLDGLRFRADSMINSIIRDLPDQTNPGSVVLIDAERLLANSPLAVQSGPGKALFYDHVHLSFAGNFIVAQAMAEAIVSETSTVEPVTPSIGLSTRSLAFSEWDQLQVASMLVNQLLNKPPFTNQWGYQERQLERRREVRRMAGQMTPAMITDFKTLYQDALKLRPRDTGLRLRFSRFLSNLGEPTEARKILRKIISDFPGHHEARLELSNLAAELRDFEEAERNIGILLKDNPYSLEVRNAYMRMLYDNGRLSEAESYSRELVGDHPADPDIRYVYALILNSIDKTREALGQLREALAFDSRHAESRSLLQKIFRETGNTAGALENAKAWVAADGKSVAAQVALAECLSQNKDYESSAEHYRRASELDPDHVIARSRFVQLMAGMGRIHEAIEFLKAQLGGDPDMLEGYSMLGLTLDIAGRKSEAMEVFRSGLERFPNNQKILRELAWMLATAKSVEFRNGQEAVNLAEKLVDLHPGDADYRNVLAAAYAENRRFSEAVREVRQGIELAQSSGRNALLDLLNQCLVAYQAGQPIRTN